MKAAGPHPRIIRFGDFEADLDAGELHKHGARVRLQEQPLQILTMLVEQAGDVVSREKFRQALWPADTFVDFDHGLSAAVNKLRDALCDSADHPRYVETIPRRGYRFIAHVDGFALPAAIGEPQAQPTAPRRAKTVLRRLGFAALGLAGVTIILVVWNVRGWRERLLLWTANARIQSIAVLPLENLSGDPSQEYFADGMTDELITHLAKISALRVTSRTSVMRYRNTQKPVTQIGKELGVDAVIEGAVVRSGDKIRITVQLVHTPTDRHLWAEEYARDFRDVLLLQSEVARDIARQIRVRLTPQEQAQLSRASPVNPEVHELYLRGMYFSDKWTTEGAKRAIGFFGQAIQKEPGYAPAYAALGVAYGVLGIYGDVHAYTQAKTAAQKALELDESLPEAHTVLAWAEFTSDWDVAAAEREFRRAIELNPSYATGHAWYGMFLGMLGRIAESLQEAEQSRRLDPLSLPNITLVWRTYYNGHQYDKAMGVCREALDMDPTFVRARERLVTILEQKGDFEKAIEEHRQVRLLDGEDRGKAEREADSLQKALARDGPRGYWLEKLRSFPSAKSLPGTTYSDVIESASIQTRLGNKQEAFLLLQKACDLHVPYLIWVLPGDPAFDPIRSDPRYRELLRCIGVSR